MISIRRDYFHSQMNRWRFSLSEAAAQAQNPIDHLAILQRIYDHPPEEVEVNGYTLYIYDPKGEHDFTVNYNYGDIGTLDGASVQEVVEAARAGDQEIMVEIFIRTLNDNAVPLPLENGPVGVEFPGPHGPPELQGLAWDLMRLEEGDEDWEISAI